MFGGHFDNDEARLADPSPVDRRQVVLDEMRNEPVSRHTFECPVEFSFDRGVLADDEDVRGPLGVRSSAHRTTAGARTVMFAAAFTAAMSGVTSSLVDGSFSRSLGNPSGSVAVA